MNIDFTLQIYNELVNKLMAKGLKILGFSKFIDQPKNNNLCIFRHDVDRNIHHSLTMAQLEYDMEITSTYYFRIPKIFNITIIEKIASLGHEIGYHYETMDTANGDVDLAWDQFRYNLDQLRKLVNVKTICMHGSPRSKFDNRDLWNKYDYRTLGIIGEPYYDVDFNEVFYLTDTGRRWDGWKVSVRDKVPQQEEWVKRGLVFHSTNDIIKAIEENRLPKKVMFTFHPQRWHNNPVLWTKELLGQSMKNVVKRLIIN